ncbi:antibiotic biosynthesis monooxygenase [Streptomyces sp. SCA3-4]|uniref:antibiotic biosynthesis monooxygenase n=1 Tax=Streptomyces sichuanensis TaxID=2871810 RepID=UPI001CE2DA55|nr:antibiotic biosynthesis monooxygenase [Streptomyces sichuanensis]MCA6091134.1 antibiotic biosynthesis monooxygenase [Streptomyces sichuanensis]
MKTCLVAFHYPHASHREEFIARVRRVAEIFRRTPGCLSADCWVTDEAVASTVHMDSAEALDAALATVMATAGADIVFDDRETRPREIHRLTAP